MIRIVTSIGAISSTVYQNSIENGNIDLSKTSRNSFSNVMMMMAKVNEHRMYVYCILQVKTGSVEKVGVVELVNTVLKNVVVVVHYVPNYDNGQLHWIVETPFYLIKNYLTGALLYEDIPAPNLYFCSHSKNGKIIPLFTRVTSGYLDNYPKTGMVQCSEEYSSNAFLSGIYDVYCKIFALSEYQKRKMMSVFRENLMFSVSKRISSKIVSVPHGVYCPQDVSEKKNIAGWFGRGSSYKNINFTFDCYESLFKLGKIDGVIATCQASASGTIPEKPYIRLVVAGNDFMKHAKEVKFTIVNYIDIPSPVTLIQACSYGVIPILPKKPWATDIFGEDYPLYYGTKIEAIALAVRIIEDESFSASLSSHVSQIAKKMFSAENTKRVLVDEMISSIDSYYGDTSNLKCPLLESDDVLLSGKYRFVSTLDEIILGCGGKIDFQELLASVKNLQHSPFGQTFTAQGLYRYLVRRGYTDTLDSPVPVFVRNSDKSIEVS